MTFHKSLVFLLILLLGFFIFKNISYPLLWHDEGETAVYAERILRFGYPKIHDEKNRLYLLTSWNNKVGVREDTDAYLSSWGQYYFCAIGAFLARKTDDLYTKTACLRVPFALAGFAGILLAGLIPVPLFRKTGERWVFYALFLFLELFSVPLILHIRQVRYYALTILIVACLLGITVWKKYDQGFSSRLYALLTVFFSLMLFHVYFPALICFLLFIGIWETAVHFFCMAKGLIGKKGSFPECLHAWFLSLGPYFIAGLLLIPFFLYFRTFEITEFYHDRWDFNLRIYGLNCRFIFDFFLKKDWLFAFLILRFFSFYCRIRYRERPFVFLEPHSRLSDFLTVFFLVSCLMIARNSILFERYFIWLNPVLTMIVLLDAFFLYHFLAACSSEPHLKIKWIVFCFLLMFYHGGKKADYVSRYFHELFHPYKGPLDYLIPYIRQNYSHPDALQIVTNFEKTPYMYYLNCKMADYYNEDLPTREPDILIYRKGWEPTRRTSPQFWKWFKKDSQWDRVLFPVYDYFCNNSPESCHHLFKTKWAEYETQCTELIERKELRIQN